MKKDNSVKVGDIVNIKRDDFFDIDGGEYRVITFDEEENGIFLRKAKTDMNDSGLSLDLDYFYSRGYWEGCDVGKV